MNAPDENLNELIDLYTNSDKGSQEERRADMMIQMRFQYLLLGDTLSFRDALAIDQAVFDKETGKPKIIFVYEVVIDISVELFDRFKEYTLT